MGAPFVEAMEWTPLGYTVVPAATKLASQLSIYIDVYASSQV